jgi:hypothetical protein
VVCPAQSDCRTCFDSGFLSRSFQVSQVFGFD